MESALFAMRCDGREAAIQECMEGLRLHAGSGRLWALLIYLTCSYCNVYTPLSTLPSLSDPSSSPPPPPPPSSSPSLSFSVDNQASTPSPAHPLPSCSSSPPSPSPTQVKNLFRLAMREVPKSGEVWCEIARTLINKRNFTEARKALGTEQIFFSCYWSFYRRFCVFLIILAFSPIHFPPLIFFLPSHKILHYISHRNVATRSWNGWDWRWQCWGQSRTGTLCCRYSTFSKDPSLSVSLTLLSLVEWEQWAYLWLSLAAVQEKQPRITLWHPNLCISTPLSRAVRGRQQRRWLQA